MTHHRRALRRAQGEATVLRKLFVIIGIVWLVKKVRGGGDEEATE